MLIWQLAVPGN